jgi:hypothetical protein
MLGRSRVRQGELQFLTVVTYGRTGSTALQSALNTLPGVLVRGENYGALRGLHDYVQSIAETADRHHAGRPDHPWYGSARLDPTAVVESLRGHVVSTLLRPNRDTRVIGFKEIRYEPGHFADYDVLLDYLLFLNTLFPGIRYLMNVRDPQDAARSGWWPGNADALEVLGTTRRWLQEATADLSAILGPRRAVCLAYEEWNSRPAVVAAAFRDLGLPANDAGVEAAIGERLSHGPHAGGGAVDAR